MFALSCAEAAEALALDDWDMAVAAAACASFRAVTAVPDALDAVAADPAASEADDAA